MTENKNDLDNEFKLKISLHDNSEANKDSDNNSIKSDSSRYCIIQFKKIIGSFNTDIYIRLIKEMSNGFILALHNLNDISIYEKDFNYIGKIKFNSKNNDELSANSSNNKKKINKSISNLIETNYSINKQDENLIQFMECSKEGLLIYNLDLNNLDKKDIIFFLNLSCTGCFEIKDNYVVVGAKGVFHFEKSEVSDILDYRIDELPIRGCIKINDNYIVLTSNSILPNGEDLLCIYDTNIKRFIKKLEFSFAIEENGLNLMDVVGEEDEKDKKNNNKLLLCACKKYIESQNNGILIMDTKIGEKQKLFYAFYDTDDFEVNCFCPLKIKKNSELVTTNYFLAGGLEKEKRQGMIKLYKVQYNEKGNDKINIEYLQDIIIEDNVKFTGYDKNIICMAQSQNNGKILISSSDGNIYLFSEPNLDYYIEENLI
jgi:hypothetical protein